MVYLSQVMTLVEISDLSSDLSNLVLNTVSSLLNTVSIGLALQVYSKGRHWGDRKILLQGHGNEHFLGIPN